MHMAVYQKYSRKTENILTRFITFACIYLTLFNSLLYYISPSIGCLKEIAVCDKTADCNPVFIIYH